MPGELECSVTTCLLVDSTLGFKRMHFLWRALIPSWRFFDDIGPAVRLQYKSDTSPWLPFFSNQYERHWYQLFINAQGNLRMAVHSLVERLASEIGEIKDGHEQEISSSVTYRLLENAVRLQLKENKTATKNFQFRILLDDETMFISAQHEVG